MAVADEKKKKPETIEAVLKDILAKHDMRVGPLGQVIQPTEVISTGNIGIDHILGVGGLPRGRSVELMGLPSTGKTTCALQTAVQAQRRGLTVLYMDWEQSMDIGYAKSLGLDPDAPTFLFGQPNSLEDGMNAAIRLIETGKIALAIFDSVAGMTPNAVSEADIGTNTVALRARLMSQSMQKINPILAKTGTCAIFLNHLMQAMTLNARPGMPPVQTTPGGMALKYFASVRIQFSVIKTLKVDEVDALTLEKAATKNAQSVKVSIIKNKVASPFKETVVRSRFNHGFSNLWTAIEILIANKQLIKATGGMYLWDKLPSLIHPSMGTSSDGKRYIRGEEAMLSFGDKDPDWTAKVVDMAKRYIDTAEKLLPSDAVVEEVDPDGEDAEVGLELEDTGLEEGQG